VVTGVSGLDEVIPAFCLVEEVADVADGLPKSLNCACVCLSQQFLEFGKSHFDGIEIRRIGRQKQGPGTSVADAILRLGAFVRSKVVHDDDVSRLQCRRQLGFHIDLKSQPVHGLIEHPWCRQAVALEAGNEGLGVPVAEGRVHFQALAPQSPAAQARHLGGRSGFIQEDKPVGLQFHAWLAQAHPLLALLADIRTFLFRSQKSFFCSCSRDGTKTGTDLQGRRKPPSRPQVPLPVPAS